jgi:hypothetical protein
MVKKSVVTSTSLVVTSCTAICGTRSNWDSIQANYTERHFIPRATIGVM